MTPTPPTSASTRGANAAQQPGGVGDCAPLCAVSVDLDALQHYAGIYGLPTQACGPQVLTVALPRLVDLFLELRLPATFFVVGQDLDDPKGRAAVRHAAQAGFELANHTHSHPYDLVRRSRHAQDEEVQRCAAALEAVGGRRPVGFRAPGYTVTPELLRALHRAGYSYDSSVLPSPPYLAAKAAALGLLALRGRRSASILGSPRQAFAPRRPYQPGGHGFRALQTGEAQSMPLELPISVLPGGRLPLIGQTLLLLGQHLPVAAWMIRALAPGRLLNIELHGVDALGLVEDRLPAGLAVQPDLRLPLRSKLTTLRSVLQALAARARFVTLADAAVLFAGQP